MVALTRGIGAALIVLGVVAYVVRDVLRGSGSPTALIPGVLGLVMLALGVLAGRPTWHRRAIRGALLVAVLGVVGPLIGGSDAVVGLPAVLLGEPVEHPGTVVGASITVLLCGAYVVVGIGSCVWCYRDRVTR